jgi:AcrR family transcriptional regulator
MKQRARRDATREQILNAAERLFAARGVEATTIDDIVAAADVARGTFYYNFATKEEVAIAIGRRHFAPVHEALLRRLEAGESPCDLLRELFVGSCRWIAANRALAEPLLLAPFKNASSVSIEVPSGQPSFRGLALAIIRGGQERGEIRTDVPAEKLMQIAAGVHLQAAIFWLREGSGRLDDWIDQFVSVFLDGARLERGT